MKLPPPKSVLPPHGRWGAFLFWTKHALVHVTLFPIVALHQVLGLVGRALSVLWDRRSVAFFDDDLLIHRLAPGRSLIARTLFDEQLVLTVYQGIVIDPGPRAARAEVLRELSRPAGPDGRPEDLIAVVCTHKHEEHIGNAAEVARALSIPVFATASTLAAVRTPPALPWYRDLLLMQPDPAPGDALLEAIPTSIAGKGKELIVLESPGHCADHVSLYDAERRILFAGDSFMSETFTAPNGDVDVEAWLETLERYLMLDIDVMVEAHGRVHTLNPSIPDARGITVREAPREVIKAKVDFLRWARSTVAHGAERGLPRSVIERCLFSWRWPWTRQSSLRDALYRHLSSGEFSRAQFVDSVSVGSPLEPARAPVGAPLIAGLGEWLRRNSDLVSIHALALHPVKVGFIMAGLVASFAALHLTGRALPASELSGATWEQPFLIVESMVGGGRLDLIALWFGALSAIWATIGGAATRRIALDLLGRPTGDPERSILRCLGFCFKPSLLFPAALASVCFFLIALARVQPLLLALVLPVWLVAGLIYGALTLEHCGVAEAVARVAKGCRKWREAARLQARFLAGFALSTGLVYLVLAGYCLAAAAVCERVLGPDAGTWGAALLTAPALAYAAAYTTSNLKSLQVHLYLKLLHP